MVGSLAVSLVFGGEVWAGDLGSGGGGGGLVVAQAGAPKPAAKKAGVKAKAKKPKAAKGKVAKGPKSPHSINTILSTGYNSKHTRKYLAGRRYTGPEGKNDRAANVGLMFSHKYSFQDPMFKWKSSFMGTTAEGQDQTNDQVVLQLGTGPEIKVTKELTLTLQGGYKDVAVDNDFTKQAVYGSVEGKYKFTKEFSASLKYEYDDVNVPGLPKDGDDNQYDVGLSYKIFRDGELSFKTSYQVEDLDGGRENDYDQLGYKLGYKHKFSILETKDWYGKVETEYKTKEYDAAAAKDRGFVRVDRTSGVKGAFGKKFGAYDVSVEAKYADVDSSLYTNDKVTTDLGLKMQYAF
ncbi:MAG: hypothetical protein HQL57_08515 [Magnetococcales bacterium]|nr:hypothetical protein [Magnetococcales bacterium]